MDLSSEQLQEEKKIVEPVQKTEGELAKEQWQEAMRQYQPIMNDEEYRRVAAQQAEVAKNSWQEYLNRTVMKKEDLQTEQPVQQKKPLYRVTVLDEPMPEQTISNKEKEKRLRRLKATNQYADASTVMMQEEASKVQERLNQENQNKAWLEKQLAGPKTAKEKAKLLDNRFEEMLHASFYPEILAGDQMEQRYGQLLVRDKQMMNFVEVLNQSREYMESKSETERERIQYFIELVQTFHSTLSALSRLKGMEFGEQGIPQNDEEYQQVQMDYATNLRELMQKSRSLRIQELDKQVIEEKIEAMYQRNEAGYIDERGRADVGYAEMRGNVKRDFDWLHVEHISDFYQVEELIGLHKQIEGNPEAYQKNKEVIDSIMQDMIQQAEVMGIYAAKSKITGALELEYGNPSTKEMGVAMRSANAAYKKSYLSLLERMKAMIESVKIVLGIHKPESTMALQYLEEKQYMMPEQEQLKEKLAYEAYYYADLLEGKNEVFRQIGLARGGLAASDLVLKGANARKAILIRGRKMNPDGTQTEPDPDWNLQVVRLAEMSAVAAKKRQVEDKEELKEALTEEERAMLEQYDEVAHYDLAKEIVRVEMDKILNFDISRLYEATPEDLLKMQRELQEISMPQMTAADIAMMAYPEEYRRDAELKERPIPASLKQDILGDRLEEYSNRSEIIRRYADMARGYALQEAARKGLLTKDAITEAEKQKLNIVGVEDKNKILDAIKVYADDQLITKREKMLPDAWNRMLHSKESMRGVLQLVCRDAEEEPKTRRYTERFFQNHEKSEHDQKMHEWLSVKRYRFAGETENMIDESIFRSYNSMMNYKSLNATEDEKVDVMLEQLAAGAFLTEDSTEEEIQAARETNMEGLRTYVGILKQHYRYLMKKYGLGLDTIKGEDVMMHYQQLQQDFSNLQVDYNVITHLPEGILDMDNEEDAFFYKLIEYYNAMGGIFNHVRTKIDSGLLAGIELDYDGAMREYLSTMGQLPSVVAARGYMQNTKGIVSVINWKQPYEE